MKTALEMYQIFKASIANYHKEDNVDSPLKNPFAEGEYDNLLYQKNWIDTVQWHLEDIIRDPQIKPDQALIIKRRIDASNQDRTDLVEKIDDHYLQVFEKVEAIKNARINTESPAWAIDRLSILSLKIYHMEVEANRSGLSEALSDKNKFKLKVLNTQLEDLSTSIDQLLEDLNNGSRVMKIYRQMKMYNDPELNPVLYAQKKA